MKLYDLELSGNCYKVRLLAALSGIELDIIPVDFLDGEHKRSPLIDKNPWGEIPILEHNDLILRDAQAILIYLAKKHAGAQWWPEEAAQQAQVAQWLFTAANEIQHGPNAARLVDKFGYDLNKEEALSSSARILGLLERHLKNNEWLALNRPTLAECAVFPYVALAHEGGVQLNDYPAIQRWIDRVKALPGFLTMPAI